MPNMQKFKGQFYLLTAVFLVSLFFLFASLLSIKELPKENIVRDEFFLIQNLEIEFEKIKKASKDCEDFRYNIEDFLDFLKKNVKKLGMDIYIFPKLIRVCEGGITEYNITIRVVGSGINIYREFHLVYP